MKILLDECLPLDFRHSFPTHDAHTAFHFGRGYETPRN
jgi:predicted nuclease of predicted toxin-antitoxin system